MTKILRFKKRLSPVKRQLMKKPIPRKKMVEMTVYDCPECGTELEDPRDPDVRATLSFECPNCGYCF